MLYTVKSSQISFSKLLNKVSIMPQILMSQMVAFTFQLLQSYSGNHRFPIIQLFPIVTIIILSASVKFVLSTYLYTGYTWTLWDFSDIISGLKKNQSITFITSKSPSLSLLSPFLINIISLFWKRVTYWVKV